MTQLILFDIDGTLLNTGGAGRAALKRALNDVYGTAGPIDSYDMGGRTIREIVRDLLAPSGLHADDIAFDFETLKVVWAAELAATIDHYDVRPCTGTQTLVERLVTRDDMIIGLLTANTRATADIKLQAAGFDPGDFVVGAYGDISEVRADLIPEALAKLKEKRGIDLPPEYVIHIGDSPNDVQCAHDAGAQAIAVLTGGKPREALASAQPLTIFENLTDSVAVIDAITANKREP